MENSSTKDRGSNMTGVANGLLYLLVGGGIGAGLALLFAPKSGVEIRHDIGEISKKGYDETLDLARQLKEHSSELYSALKEKTDDVYDFVASKLSESGEVIDNVKESLDNGVLQMSDKINGKQKSSGQQPLDVH